MSWWLAALLVILAAIPFPPVERAQEARVLETAREMLGRPFHDWMIPHLNGEIRLHKPPLAYWMAAASFELFGVSDWAGRLPFALCAWLAVGLTAIFASELFGRRAAFFAGGALLGSLMFARMGRLAETDTLVLLLTTAAVYAFWRGTWTSGGGAVKWFYAASFAVGFTVLAKGLPALFPILCFIAIAWVLQRWDRLGLWVKCGAPLAAVAVAVPWFAYVHHAVGLKTLIDEARIASIGMYHRGWFFNYFAWLLVAVAPWCGFLVMAVWLAARRWRRRDVRIRLLLLWCAAILIPLCLAGQKQKHYLMPILPPAAMLIGWIADRAMRGRRDRLLGKAGEVLIVGTTAICAALAMASPAFAKVSRGSLNAIDWVNAFGVVAVAAWAFTLRARGRAGIVMMAIVLTVALTIVMAFVTAIWTPSLKSATPRLIGRDIRATYGDRPCVFYGLVDIPLGYNLRTVVPEVASESDLRALLRRDPQTIVILIDLNDAATKPLPDDLIARKTYHGEERITRVCEMRGS